MGYIAKLKRQNLNLIANVIGIYGEMKMTMKRSQEWEILVWVVCLAWAAWVAWVAWVAWATQVQLMNPMMNQIAMMMIFPNLKEQMMMRKKKIKKKNLQKKQ